MTDARSGQETVRHATPSLAYLLRPGRHRRPRRLRFGRTEDRGDRETCRRRGESRDERVILGRRKGRCGSTGGERRRRETPLSRPECERTRCIALVLRRGVVPVSGRAVVIHGHRAHVLGLHSSHATHGGLTVAFWGTRRGRHALQNRQGEPEEQSKAGSQSHPPHHDGSKVARAGEQPEGGPPRRPVTASHSTIAALRLCLRRHSHTPAACPTNTAMTLRPSKIVEADIIRDRAP